MIESSILGVTGAGQFELLCGMGELESGIRVGRVGQQRALSLQQVGNSLQELPEAESQGGLPKPVQLLVDSKNE